MKTAEFGTKVVQAIGNKMGDIKKQREENSEFSHMWAEARYTHAKSKYAKSILGIESAALFLASIPVSIFLIPLATVLFGMLTAVIVNGVLTVSAAVEMIVGVAAGIFIWNGLRNMLNEALIKTIRQTSIVRKLLRGSDASQLFGLAFFLIALFLDDRALSWGATAWFWHGVSDTMLRIFVFGVVTATIFLAIYGVCRLVTVVSESRFGCWIASLIKRRAPKAK